MQAGWLAEFRRRNVHRVLIAYLAVAWLLAQVAEFLSDAFAWPAWILRALVIVLLLGLPAAVAIAWFFEWTPAGLVREEPAPRGAALRLRPHRRSPVRHRPGPDRGDGAPCARPGPGPRGQPPTAGA